MSTLYIRHPARAEGEYALAQYALVADGGKLVQQGEGALRNMTDVVASSRRVVLMLAASDVTLLQVKVPPLSSARLKAALPGLVEELVLGDPNDNVLMPAPVSAPDGSRTVAVVQRAWLAPIVKLLLDQGTHGVSALPAQLCLPLEPGNVAGAIRGTELALRSAQFQGLGLDMAGATPEMMLQTARSLAGDAPLKLYVPQQQLGEYQAVSAEAGPAITLEADDWRYWIEGAHSTSLDLVPGLGSAGARTADWKRWRWPAALALLALLVNIAGLNVEWLRMKGEATVLRQTMLQTFRAAYPNETVILDPAAQMRKNIAMAKAAQGQVSSDEFIYIASAFGEAMRTVGRNEAIASLEFRERALNVKLKPEAQDPALVNQVKGPLEARGLSLTETAPGAWQVRSTGAKT
ncbi:type II secretion system protein GspL [Massilia cavernae]|uniref:type II secretion system protein GspL n=1 Tax=Massilia cavernae TaxID=2320864 RepID=UPI001E29291D|nr:type II secretion system protein GspL [Massilia cavernae]